MAAPNKQEGMKELLTSMVKAVEALMRSHSATTAIKDFLSHNHPSMEKLAAAGFLGTPAFRKVVDIMDTLVDRGALTRGNLEHYLTAFSSQLAASTGSPSSEIREALSRVAEDLLNKSERKDTKKSEVASGEALNLLKNELIKVLYKDDPESMDVALKNSDVPQQVARSMSRLVSKDQSVDNVYDAYSDLIEWTIKNKDKLLGFYRTAGNSLGNLGSPPLRKSKSSMRKAVQFLHNGDSVMSEGSIIPDPDEKNTYKETPQVNESSRMWAALSSMFNAFDPENPENSKVSFAAISAAGAKDKDARRGPRLLDTLSQEYVVLLGYGGPNGTDHKVYTGDIGKAILDPAAAPYIFTVNTNEIRLSDRTNSTPHHLVPGVVYTATPGVLGVAGKRISKGNPSPQSLAFILDGQSVRKEDLALHPLEFPKFLTYAASSYEAVRNNIARRTHRLSESTGEVSGHDTDSYDVNEDSLAEDPTDFEYMKDKSGNMALVHRKMNADKDNSLNVLYHEGEKGEVRANNKDLNEYLISYVKRRYEKTEENKADIVSSLRDVVAGLPRVDRLLSAVQPGGSLVDFLVSLGNSKEVQHKLVTALLSEALEFPYDNTSYNDAVSATRALIEMSNGNITDAAVKVVEAISSIGKMDNKYIDLLTAGGRKSAPFKVENYRTKVQPILNNILHGALFESLMQSEFKDKIRSLSAPTTTNLHKRLLNDPESSGLSDREFFSRVLSEVRTSDKVFNRFVDTSIDRCRELIYEAYSNNNMADDAESLGMGSIDPTLLRPQHSSLDTDTGHSTTEHGVHNQPSGGAPRTVTNKLASAPPMGSEDALAMVRRASIMIKNRQGTL